MKCLNGIFGLFLLITGLQSCKKENDSVSIKDADGNIYQSIQIGTQVWLTENLKTTKYSNGNLIGTTSPATLNIYNESSPKYQWAYEADENNAVIYGRLYTWFAATDSRNICPTGWHLPANSEWATLVTFLGGENEAGGKLKEIGLTHWVTSNGGATNTSGFTALPGGWRYYGGGSEYMGYFGYWWSSTTETSDEAWYRAMNYGEGNINENAGIPNIKKYGLSVRCVKN